MAGTDHFASCRQYVITYLETTKNQLDRCDLELNKQLQLCPIRILSIDHINRCLTEYVHSQRKYLLVRNQRRLHKFKDQIQASNVLVENSSIVSTLKHHQVNRHIYFEERLYYFSAYVLARNSASINHDPTTTGHCMERTSAIENTCST